MQPLISCQCMYLSWLYVLESPRKSYISPAMSRKFELAILTSMAPSRIGIMTEGGYGGRVVVWAVGSSIHIYPPLGA